MKFQDVDIFGTLRITGSFQVPYGYGTGSYPQNPTSGSLFLDTSDEKLYVYEGTWEVVGAQVTPPPEPYNIEYLVIAGGGGGGNNGGAGNGGGGAGGYLSSSISQITPETVLTVTVGAGGNVQTNGQDSSIAGSGISTITATGGGYGASVDSTTVATDGGSGGGDDYDNRPSNSGGGSGTVGQGNAGGSSSIVTLPYYGCGGGGAGGTGETNTGAEQSKGGEGLTSAITGVSTFRASGGCGGSRDSSTVTARPGGGGNGSNLAVNAQAGTANTGGGGGGGTGGTNSGGGNGAAGGSGVVVLRMPATSYTGTTTGSPTIVSSGNDTILIFSGSGTYTA